MQHYYYGKWENVNLIQLAKSQEKSNINVLQFLLIVTKEIVSIRYPFFRKTFYMSQKGRSIQTFLTIDTRPHLIIA